MLRAVLGTIGIGALAAAAMVIIRGAPLPFAVWLLGIGLVLTLGVVFERVHYKRLMAKTPGPEWVATPERFVDPTSGRMVQVYTKPETGERLYVDAGAAAQNKGP